MLCIICPRNISFKTLILLSSFTLLWSCQEKPIPVHEISAKQKTEQPPLSPEVLPSTSKKRPVVFDVPPLLRLSVNQVKAKLGRPFGDEQADYENATRVLIYKKSGLVLSVGYFVNTQQVDMVSLAIDRDTTAFQYLLPLGNLSPISTAYSVDTLHSDKVGFYRGIVVRPNPPVEVPAAP